MPRSQEAIRRDIFDEFVALSPENLYCDGEASEAEARATERKIRGRLQVLFVEYGAQVSEEEVWEWHQRGLVR